MNKLTAKQEMFCKEYMIDLNATQAAIRAGYKLGVGVGNFYVYALLDESNGNIFYIGKGKGKRMYSHVRECERNIITNVEKYKKIQSIHENKSKVKHLILQKFSNQDDAYNLENIFIKKLKEFGLTNISMDISTNRNKIKEMADSLLKRMKPYEQWKISLNENLRGIILNIWGSEENSYNNIKNELLFLKKNQ